ncbi:MAG: hypothetical protein HYR97_04260 [Candidatus Melainabacteria bacterium]|nr:hypothetical protein [Candidatus Melainabacteria bacterium]
MSLTVKFDGPRLLKILPPSGLSYIVNGNNHGLKIGTLNDYLDGLFGNWRTCLSEGLRRFSHFHWNRQINSSDSATRSTLIRVISPMFKDGKIVDQIPQDDLKALGVTNQEEFERCLFDLINELISLDEASQI